MNKATIIKTSQLLSGLLLAVLVAGCSGGGGTSSSSGAYYVSASNCSGISGVSYSGYDSTTCYNYYNEAVNYNCGTIYWQCS